MNDSWIRRAGTCIGLVLLTTLLSCSGNGDNGGTDGLVTESPVPYGVWRMHEQVFDCETDSLVYADGDDPMHGVLICEDAWQRFHDQSACPMTQTSPDVYCYSYLDTLQTDDCRLSVHCEATMTVDTLHRFVEETRITVSADDPAGCAGGLACLRTRVIYTWWRDATEQECAGAKYGGGLARRLSL